MYKLFSELVERSEYFKIKDKSCFSDDLKKDKEELLKLLNEEQIKKFNNFVWSFRNHYDYIYDDYCNSAICLGIKLGMEFQEFLNKLE